MTEHAHYNGKRGIAKRGAKHESSMGLLNKAKQAGKEVDQETELSTSEHPEPPMNIRGLRSLFCTIVPCLSCQGPMGGKGGRRTETGVWRTGRSPGGL